MLGLVLTHGRLAAEFRAALEHVVGLQQQFETVSITPNDDIWQRRKDIITAVEKGDSGDNAVVLTDMCGGVPSNLAISIMNATHTEIVAGINLPMLIKLESICNPAIWKRPGPRPRKLDANIFVSRATS